jgi:hypothetical protein
MSKIMQRLEEITKEDEVTSVPSSDSEMSENDMEQQEEVTCCLLSSYTMSLPLSFSQGGWTFVSDPDLARSYWYNSHTRRSQWATPQISFEEFDLAQKRQILDNILVQQRDMPVSFLTSRTTTRITQRAAANSLNERRDQLAEWQLFARKLRLLEWGHIKHGLQQVGIFSVIVGSLIIISHR